MQRGRCDTMSQMESTHFKIDTKELILKQGKEDGGTETFVYEPSNIEEERFGNLYIIGRLENRKSEFEFLPNLIASVIKREFYKLDERAAEFHFENALKKANATLHDIGKANEGVLEDAHFCAVNITGETIRLSKFGTIATLLWRAHEIVDVAKKYKRQNKKELFSTVITGDVALDDKFIFGTGKAIDLFSEKGIAKLFMLPLDEQADIISRIYQKNAQEIPLPAQALVLLNVRSAKTTWLPFGKKIETKINITIDPKKHAANVAARIKNIARALAVFPAVLFRRVRTSIAAFSRSSLHIRNTLIVCALAIAFAAGGSGYAFFRTQRSVVTAIQKKIIAADETSAGNTEPAMTMLREAQNDTLHIIPSFFLGPLAQKLFSEIEVKINRLNGIHLASSIYIGGISTSSIQFQPLFIFDDADVIYVFGNTPATIYKISKRTKIGSYTFLLQVPRDFKIDRMFMDAHEVYMVHDQRKSALLFSPADMTLTEVKKTLPRILAVHASQNVRVSGDAAYSLEGGNTIIKTPKQKSGIREKYLLGGLGGIIDFTLSFDQKEIYILTAQAVFSLPR